MNSICGTERTKKPIEHYFKRIENAPSLLMLKWRLINLLEDHHIHTPELLTRVDYIRQRIIKNNPHHIIAYDLIITDQTYINLLLEALYKDCLL